ncbi:MAG: DUF4236 domain-containing protein [Bacteroidaceae bacterium]|nr:DUF4236 domain-containing protein [Bacteroidaceae bacterium]
MGVRFNKRMNILPWLKMNVGKSGVSLTIGPKGKTLNIGSTGINVNVSLGKGVGYSKRLVTWKKLNLLSILGIGGAAAASKTAKKGKDTKAVAKGKKGATVPSLDEAIAEAEAQQTTSQANSNGQDTQLTEQQGCSWGCAALGCLATLIILALVAVVAYLLWQQYGQQP